MDPLKSSPTPATDQAPRSSNLDCKVHPVRHETLQELIINPSFSFSHPARGLQKDPSHPKMSRSTKHPVSTHVRETSSPHGAGRKVWVFITRSDKDLLTPGESQTLQERAKPSRSDLIRRAGNTNRALSQGVSS